MSAKYEFIRRLGADWRDLASVLAIPEHQQRRFDPGFEPHAIWAILVDRERLAELPSALRTIDRTDLADVLGEISESPVAPSPPPVSPGGRMVVAAATGSVAIGGDNYGVVRISVGE